MKKYLSCLTCFLLCGYLYSDTEVTKQRIGSLGPDDRVVMDVNFSRIDSDTSRLDSKIDTLSNHTEQVNQNLSDQITTNINRVNDVITTNVERLDNLERSIPNTVFSIVTKEYVENLGIKNNDLDTLCTNLSVIVTNLASRPYAVRNIDGSISIGIDDTYTNLETVINFVKKPQDSIYNNIGVIITNLASRPYITKDFSGNLVLGVDEAYTNLETVINIITK